MPGYKKHKDPKVAARMRRKVTIRKSVTGTEDRPRLSVYRSAKHIYAQVIDDSKNQVLCAASDREKPIDEQGQGKKKTDRAKIVGQAVAKKLLEKNITKVVFDRNGYKYHGRIKAVADGAREGGLKF